VKQEAASSSEDEKPLASRKPGEFVSKPSATYNSESHSRVGAKALDIAVHVCDTRHTASLWQAHQQQPAIATTPSLPGPTAAATGAAM
jgi:hypothetical protein